jgi:methionine sulfoxide reductase catalytic subunit
VLIKHASDISESEVTPRELYFDRRRFLALGAGAAALAASSSALAGTLASFAKTPFGAEETVTTQKSAISYNNFLELGASKTDPAENARLFPPIKPWTVEITGECARPGAVGFEDLIRPHQLEERIYRLRCVEAWSMVIPWIGVSLAEVLKRFEPNSRAKFVSFTSIHDPDRLPGERTGNLTWPYVEGLRIDEAMNPLAFLAVGMYGEDLPVQNGAPIRLAVPWKYGFKSGKSIVRISFTETQPITTWNLSQPDEYGFYANVNPAVDHPRWSQARERRVGEFFRRKTLMFNGYGDQVASLYAGMDLSKDF